MSLSLGFILELEAQKRRRRRTAVLITPKYYVCMAHLVFNWSDVAIESTLTSKEIPFVDYVVLMVALKALENKYRTSATRSKDRLSGLVALWITVSLLKDNYIQLVIHNTKRQRMNGQFANMATYYDGNIHIQLWRGVESEKCTSPHARPSGLTLKLLESQLLLFA